MKFKPIWAIDGLSARDYKVIWWMLDAGGAGNILCFGWMDLCSRDLGFHRITLNRILRKLEAKDIVDKLPKKGEYTLIQAAFDAHVEVQYLTLRRKKQYEVAEP